MSRTSAPGADMFNHSAGEYLPGLLGLHITGVGEGWAEAELEVRKALMAPNGFLHAGAVVTLADTAAGCGCLNNLPQDATGFTTIELKSNFVSTARSGWLDCRARAAHLGSTTQLWDATVKSRETGKTIAHFRCTQLVLKPRT